MFRVYVKSRQGSLVGWMWVGVQKDVRNRKLLVTQWCEYNNKCLSSFFVFFQDGVEYPVDLVEASFSWADFHSRINLSHILFL